MTECAICLQALKEPVSLPCGHIHCSECLTQHIRQSKEAYHATCPTCRTFFNTTTPDLNYIPRKHREFILPPIRRVFIDAALSPWKQRAKDLQDKVGQFAAQNHMLSMENRKLKAQNERLLRKLRELDPSVPNCATPDMDRDRDQPRRNESGSFFGLGRLINGNISVSNLFGSRQPEAHATSSTPATPKPENPRSWYKRPGFIANNINDFIEHAQGAPNLKRQRICSFSEINAADSPFNNSRHGAPAPIFSNALSVGYGEEQQ